MQRSLAQRAERPPPPGEGEHGSGAGSGARQGRSIRGWPPPRRVALVLAFGMVLVIGVLAMLAQRPGVHWMRSEVSFVAPASVAVWQQDLPADASLVPFAAAVERAVRGGAEQRFSSDDATLHAFVREGSSVRLVNSGGQWVRAFNRPILIVEVVDPDPGRAALLMQDQLRQIREAADDLQARSGIAPQRRIVVQVEETGREHATASRGQLLRAGVITLGVGGGLTLALAAAVGGAGRPGPRRTGPRAGNGIGRHVG